MLNKIAKLVELKSIITLILTIAFVRLLFSSTQPPQDLMMAFTALISCVYTYYFTKKDSKDGGG